MWFRLPKIFHSGINTHIPKTILGVAQQFCTMGQHGLVLWLGLGENKVSEHS